MCIRDSRELADALRTGSSVSTTVLAGLSVQLPLLAAIAQLLLSPIARFKIFPGLGKTHRGGGPLELRLLFAVRSARPGLRRHIRKPAIATDGSRPVAKNSPPVRGDDIHRVVDRTSTSIPVSYTHLSSGMDGASSRSWPGRVTLRSSSQTFGTGGCHRGRVILDGCSSSATTAVAISPKGSDLRLRSTISRPKPWNVRGHRERRHLWATTRWGSTTDEGVQMSLRVVGAGLGRTGTTSLKVALERLLGGPCYHMFEVRERESDAATWGDAYEGRRCV